MKLFVAPDEQIWYAHGRETPQQAADPTFLDQVITTPPEGIRMLGTAASAEVLCRLYESLPGTSIEVASPLVCHTKRERKDPVIAIHRMRQCLLAPSLGGWHRMTQHDYVAYRLLVAIRRKEAVRPWLQQHPAYYDLKFIRTLDDRAAAGVLAEILDPRWYIDIKNPYRLARLRAYMGLTPKYAARWGRPDNLPVVQRGALTAACWCNAESPDYKDPRNFLWRRAAAAGGVQIGVLRATQVFLTYLVRTWQQQLAAGYQQLDMFSPEDLLKGDEVDAYKEYAAQRPGQ